MSKSEETRNAILEEALDLSSGIGLEGLTIGVLAKQVGMSKSGLFGHFESKENLQCAVLDTAAQKFVDAVMVPALKQPRGLPRVEMLFSRWLDWECNGLSGGCPFIAASTEFDDRPGPVRDLLVAHLRDLMDAISRAAKICVEEGHFHPGLDTQQFGYEFWAILLSFHHFNQLMKQPDVHDRAHQAFARLVRDAQAGWRSTPAL